MKEAARKRGKSVYHAKDHQFSQDGEREVEHTATDARWHWWVDLTAEHVTTRRTKQRNETQTHQKKKRKKKCFHHGGKRIGREKQNERWRNHTSHED
jgi:hypothetical protein